MQTPDQYQFSCPKLLESTLLDDCSSIDSGGSVKRCLDSEFSVKTRGKKKKYVALKDEDDV